MKKKIVRRPIIDKDLEEIAVYIAQDCIQSALHFLEVVETTFNQLVEMPFMGFLYPFTHSSLKNIRCFPVPGYEKILLFYQPIQNGIEVVRVLHSARNIDEGIMYPNNDQE